MINEASIYEKIKALANSKRWFIAYSGGLDSQVLLHILTRSKLQDKEYKIIAIHINHNLSPNAKAWVKHCRNNCKALGVKLIVKSIAVKKAKLPGHSLEAVARNLRYAAFAEIIENDGCLLTAHHADDQAETLLLQLLRGAGPKGLSAMPEKIEFQGVTVIRPLLDYSRQDLQSYAEQHHLQWIEDESNTNPKIDRNYIRQNLMPQIKKHWAGATTTLNRVAKHCAEASELLDELADLDYAKVLGSQPNTLSAKKLSKLSAARQRNVIRHWLHTQKLATPSTVKMQQIQATVLHSRHDATPLVTWDSVEVRRYRDDVYAMPPLKKLPRDLTLDWDDLTIPLELPNELGTLRCEIAMPRVHDKDDLPNRLRAEDAIIMQHTAKNAFSSSRGLTAGSNKLSKYASKIALKINELSKIVPSGTKNTAAKHNKIDETGKLTVRFRIGGEHCVLPNRTGSHTLKNLFQEWNVPTWQRDFIPLVYCDNELIAIVGYANCVSWLQIIRA